MKSMKGQRVIFIVYCTLEYMTSSLCDTSHQHYLRKSYSIYFTYEYKILSHTLVELSGYNVTY